ncbi:hypothetical protein ACP4OV_009665 [Aristida adscensionis]
MASPSSGLLNIRAYSAARHDGTTATAMTSTGHRIEVSFVAARPPTLSHLSVHCPALEPLQHDPTDYARSMVPKAVASDAGLVLLRVPLAPEAALSLSHYDCFVYSAHPDQRPRLDLLPNPWTHCHLLREKEIAILSCADDGTGYVVAALQIMSCETTYTLHLYRSRPDGKPGRWTSRLVTLDEPLRDTVCPVLDTAELMFHHTAKTIVLGGDRGTVGWVDLWRGILLCDVLDESPTKVRDMPLPLPARANWWSFHNDYDGEFVRDVTVSQHRGCIKYVEMEIVSPARVVTRPSPKPTDTYLEWLECQKQPSKLSLRPGHWKATTWSMPIPVGAWDDWRHDFAADSANLLIDASMKGYELLHKHCNSHRDKGKSAMATEETALSLGFVSMAYPTMSMDGDVVYLLTRGAGMGKFGEVLVTAVDVEHGTLRGVAKLDTKKNTAFRPCYFACGISGQLNTAVEGRLDKQRSIRRNGVDAGVESGMRDAESNEVMDCSHSPGR